MRRFLKFFLFLLSVVILSSCYDPVVQPDNQFVQIFFKYGFRNELNTFENTYQKDLVQDGTIKITFWLTTEEQNRILQKVNEINFFSFPDEFGPDSSFISLAPDPGPQKLSIKYNGRDKTVIWYYPLNYSDPDAVSLKEINNLIISIIESKPEYKKLPPANGGYI